MGLIDENSASDCCRCWAVSKGDRWDQQHDDCRGENAPTTGATSLDVRIVMAIAAEAAAADIVKRDMIAIPEKRIVQLRYDSTLVTGAQHR
mmetsp:Transcript_4725/g.10250  ORF Transcript_4725/g.10250 Transcript_4725/m.10250 type:complete len:91 (-) Transcript_4725:85-357(-)